MSQEAMGRVNQKQRTRAALLAAARDLMESGSNPTLQDVADHAAISRATAYRYFSDGDVLLMEAALDGIASELDRFEIQPEGVAATELSARLEATVLRIIDMVLANEALFRIYLRGVLVGDDRPGRGARRLRWLNDAIGADRSRFTKKLLARLVDALSLLCGIEPVVVSRDVLGHDAKETRALCQWVARAIVRAAIEEASSPQQGQPA